MTRPVALTGSLPENSNNIWGSLKGLFFIRCFSGEEMAFVGNSVEGGWLYVELAYFGDGVNRILATDEFHYEVLAFCL